MTIDDFDQLFAKVRACSLCQAHLPLGPRPVVKGTPSARLLLIGQAPGTKVHHSGVPWDDASGARLRDWLGLDPDSFYDETKIAIMPMGFCYPGRQAKGGDNPPRPECAPTWHDQIRAHLPDIGLTLLIGSYAQKYYLGPLNKPTLRETVQNWPKALEQGFFPLPHPSWRVAQFIIQNPWFEAEVLPALRKAVQKILP